MSNLSPHRSPNEGSTGVAYLLQGVAENYRISAFNQDERGTYVAATLLYALADCVAQHYLSPQNYRIFLQKIDEDFKQQPATRQNALLQSAYHVGSGGAILLRSL